MSSLLQMLPQREALRDYCRVAAIVLFCVEHSCYKDDHLVVCNKCLENQQGIFHSRGGVAVVHSNYSFICCSGMWTEKTWYMVNNRKKTWNQEVKDPIQAKKIIHSGSWLDCKSSFIESLQTRIPLKKRISNVVFLSG